jgi:hypothetical protein
MSTARQTRQFTVSVTVVDAFGKPALVPVIVKVIVPFAAFFDLIVSVELVPLTDDGLKLPVRPVPMPLTESVTGPVKPPFRVIVTAYVVLPPLAEMFCEAGVADTENEPAVETTKLTVVVRVRPPPTPVTVTVYVPGAAVPAFSVNTDVLVVEAGEKLAPAPLGSPDALRPTDAANPLLGLTVIVVGPLPPAATVTVDGDAVSEKFGVGTVSVIGTVRVSEPLVPVIVSG